MRRLALVVPVLLVAACGSGPDPAPTAVTAALSRVDRLVAAHHYAEARLALDDLVRRTAAARATGALDDERAQRITSAAAQLSAALPSVAPAPAPSAEAPRDRGERKGDDRDDKDDKKREGKKHD